MRNRCSVIMVLGGVALLIIGALLSHAPMAAAQDGGQEPAVEPTCPGLPGCTITVGIGPDPAYAGQALTAQGSYQPCSGADFTVRVDWGDGSLEDGAPHEGSPGDDPVPYSFSHLYTSEGDYAIVAVLLHQGAEGQDCAAVATELVTVEPAAGSITVVKSDENGALPEDWAFQIEGAAGSPYLALSGETVSDLPLGTYTLTELGPEGWHLASVAGEGCTPEGQGAQATLLSPGESITCTLTNEVDSPSVALEKYVSDDNVTWRDADAPPGPNIAEFDPAFWRFNVSNTGNLDLVTVVVTDTALGEICTIDSLVAGAEEDCQAMSLAEEGQHDNVGFVTAQYMTGTVTAQDPCHYYGVAYLVPTATPTPEPTAPRREKATPVPAAPAATPVPPAPTLTPTPFVEVLGVERLPESGASPLPVPHDAWLSTVAVMLIACGLALRLRRDDR
jgi:hypothetical protein